MAEPSWLSFDRRKHRTNGMSASSLRDQGKHAQAAVLLQQNLAMSSKFLSGTDMTVLSDRDSLSDCLRELGDYEGAIKLDEGTLAVRQRLDDRGEDTIATLKSLADNLSQIGQHKKAIPLYQSALSTRSRTLGLEHEDTLDTEHYLASCLHEDGQYSEASRLNTQVLKIREEQLAADDYNLIATRHNLATNHYALGAITQAAELTNRNLQALNGNMGRASTDAQLQSVVVLQERIKSTIQRARAVRARKEAEVAQRQAGEAPTCGKGQFRASENIERKGSKVLRADLPAKARHQRNDVENPEVKLDNVEVERGILTRQRAKRADTPRVQAKPTSDPKMSVVGSTENKTGHEFSKSKKETTTTTTESGSTAKNGHAESNALRPISACRKPISDQEVTYPRRQPCQDAANLFRPKIGTTTPNQDDQTRPKPERKEGNSLKLDGNVRTTNSGKETSISLPSPGSKPICKAPNSTSSGQTEAAMMLGHVQETHDENKPSQGEVFEDVQFKAGATRVSPKVAEGLEGEGTLQDGFLIKFTSPPLQKLTSSSKGDHFTLNSIECRDQSEATV
ncbi:MAG: hypothetical protein Q9225_004456 [Loekoesia sp. 1 TL-2023]